MTKPTFGGKPVNLNDGEEFIWRGQPAQGILRNPAHMVSGVALAGLGLWLTFGLNGAAGSYFGLLFSACGIYLVVFHAKVERTRRAGTYYALTNQRALLAYGTRALAYRILPKSRIQLKKGRYDTVFFAVDRQIGVQSGSSRRRVGFGHLENGQEVFDMLMKIKQAAVARTEGL